MRTTCCLVLTFLCGWLAAPAAGAMPQATEAPPTPREQAEVREATDAERPAPDEAPPVDMPAGNLALLRAADPDEAEARLRDAEAIPCPAAPGGTVWLEHSETCGATQCFEQTMAHVGSSSFEEERLDVRCALDHVVLSSEAWELTLAPDASGRLNVSEDTMHELEALAAKPSLDEATRLHIARLYEGLRVADGAPPYSPRTLRAGMALLRAEIAAERWEHANALRHELEEEVPTTDTAAWRELSTLTGELASRVHAATGGLTPSGARP